MKTNEDDMSDAGRRELAAGVLKQAKQDLRRFRGATSKIEQELFLDAFRWITADDFSWPFSFLNVCRVLNLAPETVRQDLTSDLSLGGFASWARRCRGATRRFGLSFRQLFVSEPIDEPTEPVFRNTAASTIHI